MSSNILKGLFLFASLANGVLSDTNQGGGFVQDSYSAPISAPGPKETYSAPASYEAPPQTYSYNAPSAVPSGSYYASDYPSAHGNSNNFGFGGNVGVGFPNAQNLISTGLSIAVGVFFISLVFQMISKLAASNIFEKIFDGLFGDEDARYFYQGTIDQLTNLAVEAIHKLREQYEEKSE